MKWTEGEITELKEMCSRGVPNKDIARYFGCALNQIYTKRSQLGITIDKCKGKAATPNQGFDEVDNVNREHQNALFARWQDLVTEKRRGIFPSLFGRMRALSRGTKADRECAEKFFMEVESLIKMEE